MHTVIYIHLCNCIWCSRAPRNGHTPVLAPRAVSSAHQETAFQPGHRLPRASISPGHSPEGLLLLALPVAICHFLQPAWCQCQSWPPLKLLLPQQAELPSPSLLPPLGPPRWPTRRFQQSCRHPFQVGPAARTPDRPCVYLHGASRRASPSPATSGPSAEPHQMWKLCGRYRSPGLRLGRVCPPSIRTDRSSLGMQGTA